MTVLIKYINSADGQTSAVIFKLIGSKPSPAQRAPDQANF